MYARMEHASEIMMLQMVSWIARILHSVAEMVEVGPVEP